MNENKKTETRKLRTGFTTGACATAAAKAAWILYNGEKVKDEVSITFPDRKHRSIKLESTEFDEGNRIARASVIKDAGDDPDVTDNVLITVKITPIPAKKISGSDFTEDILDCSFVIRGGKGVGLVTRQGLPVPEGKWAINPVPRKMISENISSCDFKAAGLFLLEISVRNGERIAKKTLNPTLGIKGGISILGTSGIVVPYSNKAYLKTVKILLNGAKMQRVRHIALCTGGTTAKSIRKMYPDIPEQGIIRIGDFINPSIKHASSLGFEKITVACMPGKLLKYAEGHRNTHAHNVKQQMGGLAKFAEDLGFSGETISRIKGSSTVREILNFIKPDPALQMMNQLAGKALGNFFSWTGSSNIELVVFDTDGKTVTKRSSL
ncbi:MAG TPA: cobalamin biosynthesis protein CbiD [Lentisphaeria bacterium]|nr:MAG: cobalamin biosynthesis protein CbiD [Lentisphaerae bacterium GWF2_49_21]HBC88933.1 cobalamin biosynthesis protein CbiD [Lentisphaeria bacterium]